MTAANLKSSLSCCVALSLSQSRCSSIFSKASSVVDFLLGIKSVEDGDALEQGEMLGAGKAEIEQGEGLRLGDGQGRRGVDGVGWKRSGLKGSGWGGLKGSGWGRVKGELMGWVEEAMMMMAWGTEVEGFRKSQSLMFLMPDWQRSCLTAVVPQWRPLYIYPWLKQTVITFRYKRHKL